MAPVPGDTGFVPGLVAGVSTVLLPLDPLL
jgi:hypothetical protein